MICYSSAKTCLLVPAIIFSLAGCQRGTSISGRVTFEGKDVDKGTITFQSTGSLDPHKAADIVNGKYHVPEIKPGQRKVVIASSGTMEVEKGPDGKLKSKIIRAEITVPHDAAGNNQLVDIVDGPQVLEFHLRKNGHAPSKSGGS